MFRLEIQKISVLQSLLFSSECIINVNHSAKNGSEFVF